MSGGAMPATSLLLQSGARTEYDERRGHFALSELPAGVFAAGEVAGVSGDDAVAALGRAGRAAGRARARVRRPRHARADCRCSRRRRALTQEHAVAVAPPVAGAGRGKCFACFCEDVTSKDIGLSIDEGYDSIELSKRYTTVTMGPCQGRMCQLQSVRLMAQHNGSSLGDVGVTTARPPWVSVPMGILGGRPVEPAKRSSIHGRHRALGANVKWAGDWRRAYDYGDPAGEALAVNRAAGLIDVSTLGKLLVRGADAGAFLDRLYPNRFSDLKPGRIRYGVISSDAGRIVDDGTICRLDDETYYVTTTSSGAGAVEEWFGWWLADWKLDVRLTDLTQGMAAVNLAGPRAREIISAVSDVDYSNEAFKYLDGKHATIAGVRCLVLRIGFVGEVGYEIHCPAAFGEHVWDALMAAGEPHGLQAVRARAPARAAAAEDAHPRRPGHRLGVDAVRGRDAVDRQARQGAGLHRQVGAAALLGARRRRPRWSASRCPTAMSRPRARSCSARTARPPGRSRAHGTRRCSIARSGWPGCRRRWPTTAPRSRSPTSAGS